MAKNVGKQEAILGKVKDMVRREQGILGMWVVGSLARGDYDSFSDIDLYLLVDEDKFDEIYAKRRTLAEEVGPLLSTFEVVWDNCQLYGVIYESCIEVDFCYTTFSKLEIFGPFKIVIDKKGILKPLLEEKIIEFEVNHRSIISNEIDFIPYNIINLIHQLARGNLWEAFYHLETLRNRIIKLIYGLKNQIFDEEFKNLREVVNDTFLINLEKSFVKFGLKELMRATEKLFDILFLLIPELPKDYMDNFEKTLISLKNYYSKLLST